MCGKVILPASEGNDWFARIPIAVEAAARWVRELEKKGDLQILDPELNRIYFEEKYPLQQENAVEAPPHLFDHPPWRVNR